MPAITFINPGVQYTALAGQEEWTSSSGTFTWIVPRGVFAIHAVCIGGGGGGGAHATAPAAGGNGGSLSWANKIAVTPGESLTVTVGNGGSNAFGTNTPGGGGGQSSIFRGAENLLSAAGGAGGGAGQGVANTSSTTPLINGENNYYFQESSFSYGGTSYVTTASSSERCSGGGGAAGYAANQDFDTMTGGVGGPSGATSGDGTSGGGGGGGDGTSNTNAGDGGGSGPWGEGASGGKGGTAGWQGSGGSAGFPASAFMSPQAQALASVWSAAPFSQNGGLFGGGGGGGLNNNPGTGSGFGARGCVRIMWGEGRGYPSTNTGNYYGTTAVSNSQQNYFTPGTYTWTVPTGVREFSVCAIGGGGAGMQGSSTTGKGSGAGAALAWANFSCMPGESFTIVAGAGGQSTALNTATAGGSSTITRNVSFRGFTSGTSLFITEMLSGLITTGITITGSGVSSTTINAFVTGENGFEGTYTIGVSQTVGTLASPITFSGTLLLLTAGGGAAALAVGGGTPAGGTFSVHSSAKSSGGGNGGAGGTSSSSTTAQGGSGGGAGGYQGTAGGAGRNGGSLQNGNYPTPYVFNRYSLTGGSSSGRTSGSAATMGAGGGGTGIYGIGKDALMDTGQVSSGLQAGGIGGSGGTDGATWQSTGQGGQFGGGGGGAGNNFTSGRSNGGIGGVRITWGARHKYPAPTTDV